MRALGAGALTAAQRLHVRVAFRRRWLWPGLLAPPLVWTEARDPVRRGQPRLWWVALGGLLAACTASRAPAVGAVDSLSLLRTTTQVATTCLRVVALRDSLDLLKRRRFVQAAQRLPQHLRDSLREVRWTTR